MWYWSTHPPSRFPYAIPCNASPWLFRCRIVLWHVWIQCNDHSLQSYKYSQREPRTGTCPMRRTLQIDNLLFFYKIFQLIALLSIAHPRWSFNASSKNWNWILQFWLISSNRPSTTWEVKRNNPTSPKRFNIFIGALEQNWVLGWQFINEVAERFWFVGPNK